MEARAANDSSKSGKEPLWRWGKDRRSRTLLLLLAAEFLAGIFLFSGILRPAETARLDVSQMMNPNGEQIGLEVWADGSIGYAPGQERRFARLKEQAGEENSVPMLYSRPFALKAGQMAAEGSALPNGSNESGLEYLPQSFDPARIETPEINCPPEIVLQSQSRLSLGYTVTAENQMAAESGLEFPLTYYPGYRITDNSGAEIRVSISDHGQVAAVLPANYSGTFTVRYQELFRWRAAELISLVTVAALAAKAWADRSGFLKRKTAKKQNRQNG